MVEDEKQPFKRVNKRRGTSKEAKEEEKLKETLMWKYILGLIS